MKKRIFAGIMAFFMIFTLISPVEAKAEENYGVSITLPEGAEAVELTDDAPEAFFEGATLTISGYEGEIIEAIVYYVNEEYDGDGFWFYPTEEAGVLTSDLYFDADWAGTYTLVSAHFLVADDEWISIDTNLPESSITVTNTISDREAPVITDLQMEGCGETFVQGQNGAVTITAKILDEGLGVNETSVTVSISTPYQDWYGKSMIKQEDGTYAATFYVDGDEEIGPLYTTDWRVVEVLAADMVGNLSEYYPEDEALDLYFYVEDADGYCDTAREDITLSFRDDEYNQIEEYIVSSTDRFATLEELLDTVPEYETDLGFEGWRIEGTDIVLKNDTEFVIPNHGYWFDFVPETTIKQVYVDIYCLDENGSMQWTGYEPYVIPEGTTYAELLEMLPTPESVDGCNFVRWQFSDSGIDLSEEVDMDYVDVEAIYDKMIISIAREYFSEEGDYTFEMDTMVIEEGTTYKEVLELLEAPETYPGCTFEGWTYSYLEASLDDAVTTEDVLAVCAEYDKYPVSVVYLYVGNDGEAVFEETKEIYEAGILMQDIRDEWTTKLSGKAEGVTEWYTTMLEGEISLMNCSLLMIAQYEEQVIVVYDSQYLKDAGEYGVFTLDEFYGVLDKDDCTEENIAKYFEDEICKEISHYKGATYDEWHYEFMDINEDGFDDLVMAYPDYQFDTAVVYAFGEEIMVYAVEAGQTISLPTEIDGYYVTWEDMEGNEYTGSYTVPSEMVAGDEVYLSAIQGEKVEDENDTPTDPDTPADPDQPTDPEQPTDPDTPADPEQPVNPDQPANPEDPADKPVDKEEVEKPTDKPAPETGDSAPIVVYVVTLMVAAVAVVVALKKRFA